MFSQNPHPIPAVDVSLYHYTLSQDPGLKPARRFPTDRGLYLCRKAKSLLLCFPAQIETSVSREARGT
jgi:hypothetical protein